MASGASGQAARATAAAAGAAAGAAVGTLSAASALGSYAARLPTERLHAELASGVAASLVASARGVWDHALTARVSSALGTAFMGLGAINLLSYAVPQLVTQTMLPVQNLGKKYDSAWALVTGASSGLGEALADRLASQGTNVVLVALDNQIFTDCLAKLAAKYPTVSFRAVKVDMANSRECIARVIAATSDINVYIIFNNAGYVYLESFEKAVMAKQEANIEVLVMSSVRIADHFYKRMRAERHGGCIVFTSSQGAFFPSPLSTVYSGSKAFVSAYAQAMAVEGAPMGIDVMALQPGYMRSNFTKDLPSLKLWDKLNAIGQYPEDVATNMFRAVGRLTLLDSGIFSWGSRLLTKVIDLNPLVSMVTAFSALDSDYQSVMAAAPAAASAAGAPAPASAPAPAPIRSRL